MLESLEICKDWLLEEIIKTDFKEKETGKKEVVTISKMDLLRFTQKLIKLNENGG